jgi:hypothetical protein
MDDGKMTDSLTNPNSKMVNDQQQQESAKLTISQSENKKLNITGVNYNRQTGDQRMMMSDNMQTSPLEFVTGGLYHFWNGATMAAVYTLVIGRGR